MKKARLNNNSQAPSADPAVIPGLQPRNNHGSQVSSGREKHVAMTHAAGPDHLEPGRSPGFRAIQTHTQVDDPLAEYIASPGRSTHCRGGVEGRASCLVYRRSSEEVGREEMEERKSSSLWLGPWGIAGRRGKGSSSGIFLKCSLLVMGRPRRRNTDSSATVVMRWDTNRPALARAFLSAHVTIQPDPANADHSLIGDQA